jgi:phospholipase C
VKRGRRIALTTALVVVGTAAASSGLSGAPKTAASKEGAATSTPIKHLVVLFQENVSYDHYFATYPNATNPASEPAFTAQRGTAAGNGLSGALLTRNPNLSNPQRLDRSQAVTCDQDHEYTAEQSSFNHGLMDKFVQDTGNSATVASCTGINNGTSPNYAVMDYYDGNTVTALWNYAQKFAMSDNNVETGFGPSTPGVLNLVGANTFGATCGSPNAVFGAVSPCPATAGAAGPAVAQGPGTVYSDSDPHYDICSKGSTIAVGGSNIGDTLNAAGVSWGWFEGGFGSPGYVPGRPSTYNVSTVCTGTHKNIAGSVQTDYSAHHQPFQYYPQTANPAHLPPTSVAAIGHQDQANHQYDLADFWAAANAGNMPAVSFLKAPRYQDGHAGYSDPLDEQHFLVNTVNALQRLDSWSSTAVVITYDDSDGWYDHVMPPIVNQSQTALDTLSAPGQCGASPSSVPSGQQARCGFGARLPLLVISPFARENAIYSGLTDQSSIIRFVEDNWGLPRLGGGAVEADAGQLNGLFDFSRRSDEPRRLILDPTTGQPRAEQR